ncbi:MAG: hypothetical protein GWP74_18420 [Proteobacteria bacterium]|nr:hypothetical protein [Pseudomonadota bacterium]
MLAAPTGSRSIVVGLAIVILIGVAVAAYAPGLDGLFVFDSVERVIRNESLQMSSPDTEQFLAAAYAAQADYPQRGLAYVTLALNYYFAGQQFGPFAFKATNLAIHILNGLLVLILAKLILSRWWQLGVLKSRQDPSFRIVVLAIVAMGLWLLHPIQLTSVLYVVQRMTSLAATWVLAGAIVFVIARARFQEGRRYAFALMSGGVGVCVVLGFLCKQSALLLPAYIAVLELFLFDRGALSSARKRALALYFGDALILPVLLGLAIVLVVPELIVAGYEGREFDMPQRLLTQARVLFFYLGLLLIPDIRRFGLYHDDVVTSTGLFSPGITVVAVLAWAVILVLIVWGARRRQPWAFAATWFLVGHGMESTILPLELVHEHRNYVPSVGIWVAVVYYACVAWEHAGRRRWLVVSVLGVWLLTLAMVSHMRAQSWRSPPVLMETLARHHPDSYRSAVDYAFNSIPLDADLSIRFDAFKRAATLDSRTVVPLIEMAKIATALGNFIADGERVAHSSMDTVPIAELKLLADGEHNARLLATLDELIKGRLSVRSVRTDSVIALISLVDCALNADRECLALRDNSRRWHDSALSNERLPANYAAALQLSVAKILASTGDYDAAVRRAQRAGELAADSLEYRLQEATLYALLQRWDDLTITLDDVESRFPVRANADPRFRNLRGRREIIEKQSSD